MNSDHLRGVIERITYHNEENGYTVAQLIPEDKNYTIPVIGNMLGIHVGESVELRGRWTVHAQYGRQFQAENVRTVLPATIAGLEKYLGSGLIKGVGPVTAKRIVRHFGLTTLKVIEEEPQRLHEVLGVGHKRADLIARAWVEQQKIKEVMLFLQSHNVTTGLAVKIYKAYGDEAIAIVEADPYRLARDIFGIGFITADKIAREVGIAFDAPERVAAGVAYVLSQAADEGNVYLPDGELARRSAELLGVSEEQAAQGIATLAADGQVMLDSKLEARSSKLERPSGGTVVPGSETENSPAPASSFQNPASSNRLAEERPVYLTPFYYGELGVANRLRRLVETPEDRLVVFQRFDWPAAFATLQAQTRLALTPGQQDAVQAALTHRVAVLTGGPGTGKTTCTRSILRLAESAGKRVALASPTGRAAKRLSEATGRQAKTVHRLLEFKPAEGMAFQRCEENPLEADLLIVDETSMLDLLLTNNLLKAVSPGTHVLFVGDIDQLPSVGAGNVLKDIIAAIEGSSTLEAGSWKLEAGETTGRTVPAGAALQERPGRVAYATGQPAAARENQPANAPGNRMAGARPSPRAVDELAAQPANRPLPHQGLRGAAVVRLNTIFRQPEGSYIIVNAHRINQGQMPVLDNRNARDFFLFKEEDPEKAAKLVVELVKERIPRKFGLPPEEIQVLSPMHRGVVGVGELNTHLQEAINAARPGLAEHRVGGRVFRVGDRVMQIRNNYDKDVFNGDMGQIAGINLEDQVLTAGIDGRAIDYDFVELDEIVHAYAVSIHKSQGSEFAAVVIPLLTSHYMMLQRNLLYTAVTRAKRLVVLVGSPRAIAIAVHNNRAQERYTGLAERLRSPAQPWNAI